MMTRQLSSVNLAATALYYLSFIMLGLAGASLGPTLPYLASNSHSTLKGISVLLAARSIGYLMGALLGAGWFDRVPGHRLIAFLLIGMAVILAGAPMTSSLWMLFGLMLLIGAFESTIDAGANMMLVWMYRERVGPYMNGLHFAFGVGAFLVPLVVALSTAMLGSPAWAYWSLAILSVMLSIPFFFVASPSLPSFGEASVSEELQTESADAVPVAAKRRQIVVLIGVFFFFYSGVEISFGNWIYSYAVKTNLADDIHANYLTSAFWGAFTMGRLLTIPLAAKLHPSTLLWMCLVGAMFSVLPMLVYPNSLQVMWLGSILLGLAIAAIFPGVLSFAERLMPIKGNVMRVFYVGVSLGSTVIPWLIGQLFENIAPYVMIVIVSISLTISVGVFAAVNVACRREMATD
jgi:MFS transporter, FHS family, Na+ dependent glucose transporter 1